jgi:hypothetical protein
VKLTKREIEILRLLNNNAASRIEVDTSESNDRPYYQYYNPGDMPIRISAKTFSSLINCENDLTRSTHKGFIISEKGKQYLKDLK